MIEASEFLLRDKNRLIELWESEARKQLQASSKTESLSLRDHLPDLLEDIISVLNKNGGQDSLDGPHYEDLVKNSKEHGRHRASSLGYDIDQILREFLLFHQILIKEMQKEGVYSLEVGIVLQFSIENSMLYSAIAFNETLIKMREKLMGVLAHDMRNPLAVARVALEVMENETNEEKIGKLSKMGRNGIDRALKLLEELLQAVSIKAGEGVVLNFCQTGLLEEIQNLHREAREIYSNEIQLISTEKSLEGIFDGTMVRRALENLVSNAVKYGSWNRPVTISVNDMGELVQIQVHNEGNPIAKERQQDIFDFLTTTRGNGVNGARSWGMGLPLVVAVAQAHGGGLDVESGEKTGTTFSMTIKKQHRKPGKERVSLNFEKKDL